MLMDDFEFFCQLPLLDQALVVCSAVCIPALLIVLICAPRRDCFFFRWHGETRLLVLMVAPTLVILWPLLLYGWFPRSRGVDPADFDLFDDD
jgi:hypothetical protein